MSIRGLHPDDMVIVPRFARSNKPRERVQERRREEAQKREIRRTRGRQRLSRLRRRQAGGKGARNRFGKGQRVKVKAAGTMAKGAGKGAKLAARGALQVGKLATRAIPIVGWALLLVDVVMLGIEATMEAHHYSRMNDGMSERLIGLEDAAVRWGADELLDMQNDADTRAFFESDAGMLRAIGQQKGMNSSMTTLRDAFSEENKKRVIGADRINRDPYFDSADTLLDKAIAVWNEAEIPGLADETIRKMKAAGYGNTKAGR